MGFAAKAKSSREGWGMGFLFVFLPEDDTNNNNNNNDDDNVVITKKTSNNNQNHHHQPHPQPFSSSPTAPSLKAQPIIAALLKRTNSYHLLSTAQSTISICALLFFVTLLLFTLSTFEPTTTSHHQYHRQYNLFSTPRRQLSSKYIPRKKTTPLSTHVALQGMGKLYRRGTKAMNDLVIAHVVETLTSDELRIFLRLLHRSGLTSRSDLLFVSSSYSFDNTILEENDSFLKLIDSYTKGARNATELTRTKSFDVTQFVKSSKKEKESKEPIWGRKIRGNSSVENRTESTRQSYGSVVSFDVDELDPENALGGLLDHVPMSLRRWACYPMLLGRVRRIFKHTILVDVKQILLLGDPLIRVRNLSPETVHLSTTTQSISGKHGKKNSEKPQQKNVVNPAIIMGGARGVRRLSNAMLTEIARAAMHQQKKKDSVTELGLFNQLVGNENLLKNVNLIKGTESVPELSSLTGLKSRSGLARRGNINNNFRVDYAIIMKHICSFPLDSKVYNDC